MSAVPHETKLARALDRMGGLYSPADIVERINNGHFHAFVEGDSIAVTQLQAFPRARAVEIVLAVGDLPDFRSLHDQVVDYAAKEDAKVITAYGRLGWMKFCAENGWRCVSTSYVYRRALA